MEVYVIWMLLGHVKTLRRFKSKISLSAWQKKEGSLNPEKPMVCLYKIRDDSYKPPIRIHIIFYLVYAIESIVRATY